MTFGIWPEILNPVTGSTSENYLSAGRKKKDYGSTDRSTIFPSFITSFASFDEGIFRTKKSVCQKSDAAKDAIHAHSRYWPPRLFK